MNTQAQIGDYTKIEIVLACGFDSTGSVQIPVSDICEYGNERLSSIEGEEFLEYQLLKKDSPLRS